MINIKPTLCFILQEKPRPPSQLFEEISDDDNENGEVKPKKSIVLPSSSQKDKQTVPKKESKKPSQRTVATWRRGDDDVEPSAKMLALVEQLQIAANAGDKTIVYSQCPSSHFFFSPNIHFHFLMTMMRTWN